MGWDMTPNPYVYGDRGIGNYNYTSQGNGKYLSNGYSDNLNGKKYRRATALLDWQHFSYWSRYHSVARKYTNDTGRDLQFESVKIRTCSGNSVGDTNPRSDNKFFSYSAETQTTSLHDPILGLAATMFVAIRVTNDGGKTWASSHVGETYVDRVNYNMDTLGYASNKQASHSTFGGNGSLGNFYNTPDGLTYHEYMIENCPVLEPGGEMYLHWGVKYMYLPSGVTYPEGMHQGAIRIEFSPDDIQLVTKPVKDPYIWVREPDGKWHLKRPSYTLQGSTWKNMDGEDD